MGTSQNLEHALIAALQNRAEEIARELVDVETEKFRQKMLEMLGAYAVNLASEIDMYRDGRDLVIRVRIKEEKSTE